METMCVKCREEPQVSTVRLCAKMSAAEKDYHFISEVGDYFRHKYGVCVYWAVHECGGTAYEFHLKHSSVHIGIPVTHAICSCVTTASATGPRTTLRPVPLWIVPSFI